MSLGSDFIEIIELLWDVEQFNMWIPQEHSTLAYLLDRLYNTEQYDKVYNDLLSFAKRNKPNEFALRVSEEVLKAAKLDSRYSAEDIKKLENNLVSQRMFYDEESLSDFGIVKEKYVPRWFFELFYSYMKLEETKRELAIIGFIGQQGYSKEQSQKLYKRIYSQYDILNELYFYIKNSRLMSYYPITVESISAEQLCETICKTPFEAYMFLVYLREYPEQALLEYEERTSDMKT